MSDRWFVIPTTGTGDDDDPYRPDYVREMSDIEGWAGRRIGNGGYIARVDGSADALNEMESKDDVEAPNDEDIRQMLLDITDKDRSRSAWANSFFTTDSTED